MNLNELEEFLAGDPELDALTQPEVDDFTGIMPEEESPGPGEMKIHGQVPEGAGDDDVEVLELDAATKKEKEAANDAPSETELLRKELAAEREERAKLTAQLMERVGQQPSPAPAKAPKPLTREQFIDAFDKDPAGTILGLVTPVLRDSSGAVAKAVNNQRLVDEGREEWARQKAAFEESGEGEVFEAIAGTALGILQSNANLQQYGATGAVRMAVKTAREHYTENLRKLATAGKLPGFTYKEEEDNGMRKKADTLSAAIGVTAGLRPAARAVSDGSDRAKVKALVKRYQAARKSGDSYKVAQMTGHPVIQKLIQAGRL